MIKIKRFENNELVLYEFSSYEEAFETICDWKKDFLQVNRANVSDRMYKEFCEELDKILGSYKVSNKCDKCSEEDHEGDFCRCESRNIRLAKQKRKENINNAEQEEICI
jgi:hypothetical protein